MRFRRAIRVCPEIRLLAEHLGFPSPTGLVHRLSVLLANTIPQSASLQSFRFMFEEFLADLESRFRRAIPLPDESFYIAVEQKIVEQLAADLEKEQHANSTITSSTDNLVPIGKSIFERPQLNSWWSPVPLDQPFSEWSELARMNLSRVFERLDFCIRFAVSGRRSNSVKCASSSNSRSVDNEAKHKRDVEYDDDDDALFADAVEELTPNVYYAADFPEHDSRWFPISSHAAEEEASQILSWLRSLDSSQLLRSLLPSICLESLITLHSVVPYEGRITTLLSGVFEKLESQIYELMARLIPERSTLDGYANYEARFVGTFDGIFALLEDVCERVACMYEMLEHCVTHLDLDAVDLDLDFLFRLTMGSVRANNCSIQTDHLTNLHWIPIPIGMGQGRKCFLTEFERLFGKVRQSNLKRDPLDNADILEPFRFVSNTPKWFTPNSGLTLSNPDVLEFVLQTDLAQPNPLSSRPGPQRLYARLDQSTDPETLLLAGAFSRDTQFL
ncbi:hypothetical protein FBUS_01723 [Fasciolopsis buskii]|uniref:Uncharacterized protein n=1 Tax=Fasciolopsis buskii TaxID=27845 RepID=A0A8E0RML5_9TREM|nr:hypothetical protein FBUS_01723 [Fasciolopsis buski]